MPTTTDISNPTRDHAGRRTGTQTATNTSTPPPPSIAPEDSPADPAVLELSGKLRAGIDSGQFDWPGLPLLNRLQTAQALSISLRTLECLVVKGELTPTRIGKAVRFSPKEIAAFIERKTNPPAPETFAWPTAQRQRVGSRSR